MQLVQIQIGTVATFLIISGALYEYHIHDQNKDPHAR